MRQFNSSDIGIDVEEVERALQKNRGFPIHTYHDQSVYDFELQAIFHKSWQYFAPLEKLSEEGNVVTGVIGTTPIAVTRAYDGKLYGFVNICRHRGFTVAETDKKCRRLVCRYHSWSYDLNGKLLNAPRSDIETDAEKAEFGLIPVSVDVWAQGVFVNPDPEAPSLREVNPFLDEWTEEKEFQLEIDDYRFHRHCDIDQATNWKLWYDNGTECYHCPTIHGDTFNKTFNSNVGDASYELRGQMLSLIFPGFEAELEGGFATDFYRSFQFFPGCQVTQHQDIMLMAQMIPTGPQSCRWSIDYFVQKGTDPIRADQWIAIWNETFEEDAMATGIQQKNMLCERAQPFRFVSLEGASQFIHGLTWQAYKANFSDVQIPDTVDAANSANNDQPLIRAKGGGL